METISIGTSGSLKIVDYSIGGDGIADVVSRATAYRRGVLTSLTRRRVTKSLTKLGHAFPSGDILKPIVSYHLHLEPEANLFPANGFRANQINNVALLSEWLDGRAEILVKEHPVMYTRGRSLPFSVRNRNRTFYRALSSLPNVTVLRPTAAQAYPVNKSSVVATVSGSVGWEALSLGVPVVHFGNAPYENAVGAHRWQPTLRAADVLNARSQTIADCALITRELLTRHAYPISEVNRRIGRVRAVLAAVAELRSRQQQVDVTPTNGTHSGQSELQGI
jgi:hypothetical protein